jgi:hypothetical protein
MYYAENSKIGWKPMYVGRNPLDNMPSKVLFDAEQKQFLKYVCIVMY